MLKSNWGSWLVLASASVVVFPSMLYLTRPASTDTVQKLENHAEVQAVRPEHKNQQASSASVERSVNDIDRMAESDIDSGLNNVSDRSEEESAVSGGGEHYPAADQSFSQVPTYNPPQNYEALADEASGNRIIRSGYAVSTNFQAEPATGSTKSPSRTAQKQENPKDIEASENASLYLAEIQAPVQNNKSKCPPVYMELNGYAKNMRTAMGCETE